VPEIHMAFAPLASSRFARRALATAIGLLAAMTLATGVAAAQGPGGATAGPSPSAGASRSAAPTLTRRVVRQVQRKLHLRADGALGPRTRRALERWQRAHGLRADGVPGPATLAAMKIVARAAAKPPGSVSATLARIAQCESGGNPSAVSANGMYRGKYQFSRETWRSIGGTGDPAKAPEAEQDRLAAKLYAAQGAKPWPVCGRR